jgi:hypothetical protein
MGWLTFDAVPASRPAGFVGARLASTGGRLFALDVGEHAVNAMSDAAQQHVIQFDRFMCLPTGLGLPEAEGVGRMSLG